MAVRLLAALLLLSATAVPAMPERAAEVYVGSVTSVRVGTVERVAVGNDSIVEATPLDTGDLLLLGKSPGISDVYVWTTGDRLTTWKVTVYPVPQEDQASIVREVLAPFSDVHVRQTRGMTILTGTVDARRHELFQNVIRSFDQVVSLVEPQLNVDIEDTIVFDVRILEVNRSFQRQLGVRWDSTAPGPTFGLVTNLIPNNRFGLVTDFGDLTGTLEDMLGAVGADRFTVSGYLGLTTAIGSQIDLLEEEGQLRVLAEPSLATVSGQPAHFLAGGSLPVAILNQFGQPVVEFRDFGIMLEIEPVMDRNHNIRSIIKAGMSSVDFSTVVQGVPGFLERTTTSTITARPGETIVISGLVSSEDADSAVKVPGLGDLPVIGRLFRSKEFREARTELVVMVTPRVRLPEVPLDERTAATRPGPRRNSHSLDQALMW